MKESTLNAIDRYVNEGVPTGGFLYAVLTNNLRGSLATADDENLRDFHEIVDYCYNQIPSACWGSPEKVRAWLKRKEKKKDASS